MPSFSPGRIVRLKFSSALLLTELLRSVNDYILDNIGWGIYLYDAEILLISMCPRAGQFGGGSTTSAGRFSDGVSALKALTLETAPILVSSIVPKKLRLARFTIPKIL
jgi:hypothetical protein